LAASRGTPDLTIGAGLRHFSETGDLGAVLGLSLPIPLFDRNQGAIEATEARVIQADHARRAVATAVRVNLRAELAEAQASLDEATALQDRVVPEAESAFRLAQEAYNRGRMRLTDVLDTERTLFELRARLVDALQRYHTSIADLERLAGAPLPDLSHESGRR
jgi:cobalt-zinc-cadmium efflux system outer membrane protein